MRSKGSTQGQNLNSLPESLPDLASVESRELLLEWDLSVPSAGQVLCLPRDSGQGQSLCLRPALLIESLCPPSPDGTRPLGGNPRQTVPKSTGPDGANAGELWDGGATWAYRSPGLSQELSVSLQPSPILLKDDSWEPLGD